MAVVQRHAMTKSSAGDAETEEEKEEDDEGAHPQVQRSPLAPLSVQRAFEAPGWWKKWREKRKQKKETAYNVAPGQQLPDLRYAVGERLKDVEKFDQEVVMEQTSKEAAPVALQLAEDEELLVRLFDQAASEMKSTVQKSGKPLPPAATWVKVVQGVLSGELAKMKPEDSIKTTITEAKQKLQVLPKDAFDSRPLTKFLFAFEQEAQGRAKERAKLRAPKSEESVYGNLPGMSPEDAFLEEHSTTKLAHASVPDSDRAGFSAALKKMPTVEGLLNPQLGGGDDAQRKPQGPSEWKDGGKLVDKVKKVNDLVGFKKHLAENRFKSQSLRRRIEQADRTVRTVVAPHLLARVPRPEINIHATAAQSFSAPWGFRAFANEGAIHVAYDEDMDVISHELGHAVEGRLPVSSFHDVHLLLTERHREAGGGETAVSSASVFTPKEGRYAGKYVTGKYTSTVYRDDSNEVISMAMQYFSTPESARKLVEGDPQHAGIVLRIMRPQEYAGTAELRAYDKYLPQKTSPSMLDRYSEAQRKTDALFGIK